MRGGVATQRNSDFATLRPGYVDFGFGAPVERDEHEGRHVGSG